MGVVFKSAFLDILFVVVVTAIYICIYLKRSYTYWKKMKIPFLTPHIPWGTWDNLLINPKSFAEVTVKQYQIARQKGYKFVGLYIFARPIFMPLDPLLIKEILSTSFKSFFDRGLYFNEKDDPLSAHLFNIEGLKWKNLRVKLTPTFTSGKMKMMFNIFRECSEQLRVALDTDCATNTPVDIKDKLARFTTNVIGSTAFGLDCNTFTDTDSEFRKYGKMVFEESIWWNFKNLFAFCNPNLGRKLGVRLNYKEATDFFMKIIKEVIEHREKTGIQRNDFVQLLINLKNEATDDNKQKLTLEELAAQAFVFFIAGYETSSTTMTFCLFELSVHQHIQDRLRQEIQNGLIAHGGQITYESINQIKYLEQVINETLRKYPPLPILNRICNDNFKIPNTDQVIERGTSIFIPVFALQRDEQFFTDAETFDPERFSEQNKNNITPYTYLPFGEGPRTCIGLRFGMLQTKVGLAVLLLNFRFSLNPKTKVPLTMDPRSFVLSALGDMWLNVEKL